MCLCSYSSESGGREPLLLLLLLLLQVVSGGSSRWTASRSHVSRHGATTRAVPRCRCRLTDRAIVIVIHVVTLEIYKV